METFVWDHLYVGPVGGRVMKYFCHNWFPRLYWKHALKGKWWAMGPSYVRMAQLADSPWKYLVTPYHKSEKQLS